MKPSLLMMKVCLSSKVRKTLKARKSHEARVEEDQLRAERPKKEKMIQIIQRQEHHHSVVNKKRPRALREFK